MMTLPNLLLSMLCWLFWHLARITGVLLCLAALAKSVMAYMDQNFQVTALFALLSIVALALAFFADSRLSALRKKLEQKQEVSLSVAELVSGLFVDRSLSALRKKLEKKQEEIGANYRANNELMIGMQWLQWFAILTASILLGFLGGWNLSNGLSGKQVPDAVFLIMVVPGIVLFVGGALMVVAQVRLARRVLSAKHMLKLGSSGISHCLGFDVAWKNVRGVDVLTKRSSKHTSYYLVVALSAAGVETLRVAHTPSLWDWLFIRFVASKTWLQISCALIDMSPPVLCDTARHFAKRANAAFDSDWRLLSSKG